MATQQDQILEAMRHPEFYPHPVAAIERRETHISTVFLTGSYVYKVKKPVNLGFLDFSTLDQRRFYCQREIVLNRRLSRDVYLDVVPITLQGAHYRISGPGTPLEYAVKMRQLADGDAMVQRLKRSDVSDSDIDNLAHLLVSFYEGTAVVDLKGIDDDRAGSGPPWQENFKTLRPFAGRYLDRSRFVSVENAAHAFFSHRQRLFRRRVENGRIRDCHGDLRSDHIYFTPDGIQIIDCIEFNDHFRFQDIISDLAFLAVDLEDHQFAQTADTIVERYIEQTNDLEALPLFDFYRCDRAMVRCKVSCVRIEQIERDVRERDTLQAAADRYLAMAHAFATAFNRPTLWIVFGLPASGKSTIARELGKLWDMEVLRSDVIRKRLYQTNGDPSGPSEFGKGLYTRDATVATYERMLSMAGELLDRNESVVLDATFSRAAWRAAAIDLARENQTETIFVECDVSEAILAARLRERETQPTISDARLTHLAHFRKGFEPFTPTGNQVHLVVDTGQPLPSSLRQIMTSRVLQSPEGGRL